jgi:exosome complex exonuclease DIS3/RRP44/DIS3-like exonuclease 1
VDVDDAIGVRRMSFSGADGDKHDAIEISVHIADVGYFVAENSLLDVEARARGTTTYLVDKRVDMLPELLSADLASLVAGKERLAMFCAFSLDPETFATIGPPRFGRSVIRSRHQLDYYQAQAIFERRTPPPVNSNQVMSRAETECVARDLDALARFAETLRLQRVARGAVELSSAELRFETSADAGVGDDLPGRSNKTHDSNSQQVVSRKKEVFMMRVVAELMIAANAAVATELAKAQGRGGGPALLRKHEPPPPEKFEELRVCLRENAGVDLDASSGKALSMSLALAESNASDPNAGAMFRSLATRAMSEAQYAELHGTVSDCLPLQRDSDELGVGLGTFAHYGLALPLYTHFTSPIRRYADLAVHRQLLRALQFKSVEGASLERHSDENAFRRLELAKTAKHLNQRTRAAKLAQRRSVDLRLTRALCASPVTLPAVVRSVTRTGVSLFVPSFHTQVFARVVGGDGVVFLPRTGLGNERKEDDVFLTTRVLFDGGVKTLAFFARGKDGSGEEEERGPRLRSGARAWVRLSASGGETRAARVEAELLDASHPEARLGAAEAAAEVARRVEAMAIDDRPALEARVVTRGMTGAVGDVTETEKDASPARGGDEEKESLRGGVPAAVAATFASLLGDGDARRRAPGDTRRFGVSGSGEASRSLTVPARNTNSAFRLARSAFVAARAAAAAEAMAAAGTRFGGGEDGETRRARRKRRAAAADLRADALRRAMEAARED